MFNKHNCFIMRKRIAINGIINHCCQRAASNYLLFYTVSDFLVFFTIVCVMVRKHKVRLLSLILMYDHYHISVITRGSKQLSSFISSCTKAFVVENNPLCHRSGQLFQHSFLSVPKKGDKAARTNLIYLGNNAVERRIVKKAEDYRWGFLAYAKSKNPFSDPLIIRNASWPMRKAVAEVKSHYKAGRYLTYAVLKRISSPLNKQEQLQLTDFIIGTYNVIDYDAAIRFFDSWEDMILSMHANTGSEYDLNEVFVGKSDEYYPRLIRLTLAKTGLKDIHDVFALSENRRYELFNYLRRHSDADARQIAAFLRIRINYARKLEPPRNSRRSEVAGISLSGTGVK